MEKSNSDGAAPIAPGTGLCLNDSREVPQNPRSYPCVLSELAASAMSPIPYLLAHAIISPIPLPTGPPRAVSSAALYSLRWLFLSIGVVFRW